MSPAGSAAETVDPERVGEGEEFRRLAARAASAAPGEAVAAGGLWGASQALVLAELVRRLPGPWLALVSTEAEAEGFVDDLASFGAEAVLFPARESYSSGVSGAHADPDSIRRRLQVAQLVAGPEERRPGLLVASLLSALQPIPSPRELEEDFLHLQTNQRLDTDDLLGRLVGSGYSRVPLAERPGELSLRGDVLDVFPFAAELPLRIELFDAEVESLRTFDPDTQRSLEELPRVALLVASDAGGIRDGRGVAPAEVLPDSTRLVRIEPLRLDEEAEGLRIQSSHHAHALTGLAERARGLRTLLLQSLPCSSGSSRKRRKDAGLDFSTRSVQGLAVGLKEAPEVLLREAGEGTRVSVLCETPEEGRRFRERLGAGGDAIETRVGGLSKGFRLLEPAWIVVHHRELAGLIGARRKAQHRTRHRVRALESFFELRAGDLVVHAVHGVARFAGLMQIERAGGEEEHLHLCFADEVSLYVPASRVDLVQRYVGSGSAAPDLDRIGGSAFRRRQERAERAILDLAAELLEVQAARALEQRSSWKPDADLVESLVESFPYEETADQLRADAEVTADLTSPRPMDRLLCGDVGFGKTEIAVRAAFRVASAGGQVAILVPTTVLAQQHHETFRERLAELPAEVGLLSRYVTPRKAKETIARAARGEIDVLIGTHRILSEDVSFRRLGLVIVDEEQRFGVAHKEHFKRLRAEVDLLTLTATPIPRTLHMSLSGLRDISALTEPPEGRQEIETLLVWSQEVGRIREALLREKNRGGQVFFLHNRVHSIERRARELMALVPECSFAIGHGQMSGRQLERVMGVFTRGEVDVLVATTIVENGIDIPTAGTILLDDADRFGLSELHQLRGRVGRGAHKAYCYLLLDRERPVRDVARERLKALEELTHLGAGFQISMKDLEIRGAGNILGPQQSGHIAAIGYDMYCRLLKETVERMSGERGRADPEELGRLLAEVPARVTAELEAAAVELELGVRAFLPKEWIASADERLELLRRLDGIEGEEGGREALAMLRDRYGRPPAEAVALVRQFVLRASLATIGVRGLRWRDETYLVEYSDRVLLEEALAGEDVEVRPLRSGCAHVVIPPEHREAAAALDWIEGLLKTRGAAPKMARDRPSA